MDEMDGQGMEIMNGHGMEWMGNGRVFQDGNKAVLTAVD